MTIQDEIQLEGALALWSFTAAVERILFDQNRKLNNLRWARSYEFGKIEADERWSSYEQACAYNNSMRQLAGPSCFWGDLFGGLFGC